jgi:tRNA (cmo5U34)-methyltransferase
MIDDHPDAHDRGPTGVGRQAQRAAGTRAPPHTDRRTPLAADDNERSNARPPVPADPANRDQIFRDTTSAVGDFAFDQAVAGVFDDMVGRSVPFYAEMQRMVAEMAGDFVTPGSNVYDLGCATATTLIQIHPRLPASARYIGFDNSAEMLVKAREKIVAAGVDRDVDFRVVDLDREAPIENASLVLMLLTLQFIRPLNRERLMQDIYRGMNEQGCLILIEKVLGEDSLFNRLFIEYYYDMKRRHGYSDLEISRKREALENVLIPYKLLENRELLLRNGFRAVDVFFKWYNFCGIIAVK